MANSTRNMLSQLGLMDSEQEDAPAPGSTPMVPEAIGEQIPPVNNHNYAANLQACLTKNLALDPKFKA